MGVRTRSGLAVICGVVVLGLSAAALAQDVPAAPQQQPAPKQTPATPDATQTAMPAPESGQTGGQQTAGKDVSEPATGQATSATEQSSTTGPSVDGQAVGGQKSAGGQVGGITEEELKQMLVGKPLYLRGGYLDNSLSFNEHGGLIGRSAQGSYTLSAIEIDKVHLTKHKVELDGARYGLHFLGALPYEDPTKALDRVKITPKKKMVRLTIDRELVVIPKKKKEGKGGEKKGKSGASLKAPTAGIAVTQPAAGATQSAVSSGQAVAQSASASVPAGDQAAMQTTPASGQVAGQSAPASDQAAGQGAPEEKEMSEADQKKAEIAAAPAAERPADPASVTTTTSPAHATALLKDALDKIFAPGLDDRMMAAMPDFWKLYYQAVAAKTDYKPADPAVQRQNTVDKKAKLTTNFEPESNEWAQASGVAGMALYHTVIGPDGKPGEIAVARPIGFGLDENAVAAIRKATFDPAMKDGKPVPVLLDLVVQFRIYSKRTAVSGKPEVDDKTAKQLPGPYSMGDK
ncbi:MAG: energy transducer TonB [Terracidiphilus sp.]